jgi:hypothetical protein
MTADQTTATDEPKRTTRSKKTSGGRVVRFPVPGSDPLPVPGFPGVLLDLAGDCLVRDSGTEFLDWAPRLVAWWTDAEGVPVYRIQVKDQIEDAVPETLKDGTAWDQFDHAAGHDVRAVREALASAVKMQRRTLPKAPGLAALGWHDIDGAPVYVTAGTSFGPAGEVTVNVHAYDADEAALPPAPTGDRLRETTALSLSILDAAVLRVSAPAMCSVWLAPLISLFGNDVPRFVPWMWSDGRAGVFGVLKSSFAAILQAHSGEGYRGESDLLPAADTTLPALSSVLGVRRDGLAVVDDYKPGETTTVESRTQATMEQGIRMATNRQRRAKMQRKGPGRAAVQACWALMMVTAECLPLFDSGSTHDRTFPFQVHKGDVRADRLTVLQDRVDDLPEAAAGYVAWLAAHHAEVTRDLPERFRALRAELRSGEEITGRACSHVAHMLCAAETFTRFAVEVGALAEDRRGQLLADVRAALIDAATATATERAEDHPHAVWLAALRAEFEAGRLYAETPSGVRPADYSDALGWGVVGEFPKGRAKAGYATDEGLALIESAANAAVFELVKRSGKSLPISGAQLRRTLAGKGIIRSYHHRDGLHEHLTRLRVGSRRPWCPIVPWEVFLGTEDPTTPPPAADPAPAAPIVPAPAASTPAGPCDRCRRPGEWCGYGVVTTDRQPCVCGCGASTPLRSACGAARIAHGADGPQTPAEATPAAAPAKAPQTPRTPAKKGKATKRGAVLAEAKAVLDSGADVDEMMSKLHIPRALEKTHAPMRRGDDGRMHYPYWRPELPGMLDTAHVVTGWHWEREYDGPVTVLDKSGAWIAAASSVEVAHGALDHTGACEFTGRPGYYLITVYPWTETGMPHPLSLPDTAPQWSPGDQVWVPAPTVALLRDLVEAGRWPDVDVIDSYTSPGVRISEWTRHVNELRTYAVRTYGRDSAQYEAVKRQYGQTMSLMVGRPKENGIGREWSFGIQRPDWTHAIQAHAAAMLWRRADQCRQVAPDAAPVSLRHVDELVIPSAALEAVTTTPPPGAARPAITIDPEGLDLRSFKVKAADEDEETKA